MKIQEIMKLRHNDSPVSTPSVSEGRESSPLSGGT